MIVSRETWENLSVFVDLLLKWNRQINLVGTVSMEEVWGRHVHDSSQLWAHCPGAAENWIDLGSGGGFPGIVVAIIAREKNTALSVTLVESDRRKAAFLMNAVAKLDLRAKVLPIRIEDVESEPYDVISARALAPLDKLLGHAIRFSEPGSVMLFPKGETAERELTIARKQWRMVAEAIPSSTNRSAKILKITKVCPLE